MIKREVAMVSECTNSGLLIFNYTVSVMEVIQCVHKVMVCFSSFSIFNS